MSTKRPTDGLPEQIGIHKPDQKPTTGFMRSYGRWTTFLRETFPPGDNPAVSYPPEDPGTFIRQRFLTAPALHRAMTQELLTSLREMEGQGNTVHGKGIYPHQKAHIIWAALALCDGPDSPYSLLIRGAPGTGKTLTEGVLMQAAIRLQLRGMLDGIVAYATAKPYHLEQQARGRTASRQRLLRAPPFGLGDPEIKALRADCNALLPGIDAFFPLPLWKTFMAEAAPAPKDVKRRLRESLESAGKLAAFRTAVADPDAALAALSMVIAGQRTTIRIPGQKPEFLDLPRAEVSEDEPAAYGGDAAFGIPSGYPVMARASLDQKAAAETDPRVLLTTASSFTSVMQRRHMEDVLRRIRIVFNDEARGTGALTFESPVTEAGATERPLVIAVTGRDRGRPFDRRSPEHTFIESVNLGVLPDIGVDVFPSAREAHYPPESEKGLAQLLDAHFDTLQLPAAVNLKQPRDCNTLFVVHARLVERVKQELRERYAKANPKAIVHGFVGTERDRERLQLWFVADRDGPNVLVAAAANVADALDFPNIENVTIGTRVSPELLFRLTGRLTHSARPYRGYLRQQQSDGSSLTATPFHDLPHGLPLDLQNGFRWVPLQALLSVSAYQKDATLVATRKPPFMTREVPAGVGRKAAVHAITHAGSETLLPPNLKSGGSQSAPTKTVAIETSVEPTELLVEQWVEARLPMGDPRRALYYQFRASIFLAARDAFKAKRDIWTGIMDKLAALQQKYGSSAAG
jgi:hypothetical protein